MTAGKDQAQPIILNAVLFIVPFRRTPSCFEISHELLLRGIESRPSRKRKWDYVFFIDIEGHVDDEPVKRALEALKSRASLYKVLGSYPRAVL